MQHLENRKLQGYGLLAKGGDGDMIQEKTTFSHDYILHIESENV